MLSHAAVIELMLKQAKWRNFSSQEVAALKFAYDLITKPKRKKAA